MPGSVYACLLGALAVSALGCGSAPARTGNVEASVIRDRQTRYDENHAVDGIVMKNAVPVRVERAWQLMPEVYDAIKLVGGVVDSGKRIFGAQHLTYTGRPAGKPLSFYLDCGSQLVGPNADFYAVSLTVLTHVRAADSTAILDTRIEAFAKPRSVSGGTLTCSTTGRLEKLIVTELQARAKPK